MTEPRDATKRRPGTIPLAGPLVLLACILGGLSACNTIEGAGEDIEETGEAIEDAAEDAG